MDTTIALLPDSRQRTGRVVGLTYYSWPIETGKYTQSLAAMFNFRNWAAQSGSLFGSMGQRVGYWSLSYCFKSCFHLIRNIKIAVSILNQSAPTWQLCSECIQNFPVTVKGCFLRNFKVNLKDW